ncbi:MAG: phosphatidate cytidylyltransferase [Planctomycetes bacterium]|nr:phosphatidate cytidylyltransferase [Planctomycetota bacterium]
MSEARAVETPAQAAANRKKGRGELRTRLVLGPAMLIVVGLIYFVDSTYMAERGMRGYLVAGLLGLLGFAGVLEYVAMMRNAGFAIARVLLPLYTALLLVSPFFFGWHTLDRELYPLVIGTLGLLFPIALESLSRRRMQQGLELQGATMLGFLLIAWPMFLAQGMALRHLPSVLWVALVCKGGDIGAYLTGIAIGRHKLIPHVSAGKTVEGAVGSVFWSVGIALGLRGWLLDPEVPLTLTAAVIVGIILNVTTQTGDLIESLLKRRCGVKDSSKLLPAHGGVLDLIDSLLFSFPAFFLVLTWLTP